MRKTYAQLQVARALLERPSGRHYGYDTMKRSGIRSGVVYPILQRMLDSGWLTDGWEDPTEAEGRPARRYYRLTKTGRRELTAVVAAFKEPA